MAQREYVITYGTVWMMGLSWLAIGLLLGWAIWA